MGIFDIFKALTGIKPWQDKLPAGVYSVGPNTLAELLQQFDVPPKQKTEQDAIRDYQMRESMAALEVDMLKMDPARAFKGCQAWKDSDGNVYIDWVPCAIRPEVVYCSYDKN